MSRPESEGQRRARELADKFAAEDPVYAAVRAYNESIKHRPLTRADLEIIKKIISDMTTRSFAAVA